METVRGLLAGRLRTEALLAMADSADDANTAAYARFFLGLWHEANGDEVLAAQQFALAAAAPSSDFVGKVMELHFLRFNARLNLGGVPRSSLGAYTCPRIIVGGWQLSSGHSRHPEGDDLEAMRARCVADLAAQAEAGLIASDFGDIYTGVEVIVGRFVERHVAAGKLRSDLLLHTKLVPDLDLLSTYDGAMTRRIVQRSCARLQTSYVDLVQFHWWDLSVRRYVQVALQLAELKQEGLIREIGLTNFALQQTRELREAGVPVASTQVQLSLIDRRAEASGLCSYCAQEGIAVLAYGLLAGGLLSDKYLGAAPLSASSQNETRSLTKYLLVLEEAGGWPALQAMLQTLRRVADRQTPTATIAQVVIAWTLSRPAVASAIVGARGVGQISSTLAATLLRLDEASLAEVTATADAVFTPLPGEVYELERKREGPHGSIMRYNLQAPGGTAAADELEDRIAWAEACLDDQRLVASGDGASARRYVAARRFEHQAGVHLEEAEALAAGPNDEEAAARAAQLVERLRLQMRTRGAQAELTAQYKC
ncbi:unnamed protein product [Polarella glacialis]|uniref:NADP-dependent oxidoreductase domain-containing protein n=1 Tax=Polarella glacialis TaxID=89957 RepID=A0A813HH08_POLGL|nr:unnamed protein product [Polarella glacialis]